MIFIVSSKLPEAVIAPTLAVCRPAYVYLLPKCRKEKKLSISQLQTQAKSWGIPETSTSKIVWYSLVLGDFYYPSYIPEAVLAPTLAVCRQPCVFLFPNNQEDWKRSIAQLEPEQNRLRSRRDVELQRHNDYHRLLMIIFGFSYLQRLSWRQILAVCRKPYDFCFEKNWKTRKRSFCSFKPEQNRLSSRRDIEVKNLMIFIDFLGFSSVFYLPAEAVMAPTLAVCR